MDWWPSSFVGIWTMFSHVLTMAHMRIWWEGARAACVCPTRFWRKTPAHTFEPHLWNPPSILVEGPYEPCQATKPVHFFKPQVSQLRSARGQLLTQERCAVFGASPLRRGWWRHRSSNAQWKGWHATGRGSKQPATWNPKAAEVEAGSCLGAGTWQQNTLYEVLRK